MVGDQKGNVMKNVEVEIQVKIERSAPLLKFLQDQAKFTDKSKELDEYFIPCCRNFIDVKPTKEWLRLRNKAGKYTITYKNWYYNKNGKSTHADEYETAIKDIDQLKNIFLALKFRSLIKIEKTREKYFYKDFEISLDKIRNLGDFVEIEYKGRRQQDPVKITDSMVKLLKNIGVGRITRNYVGYPFMMLFPKEIKEEVL